MAKLAIGTMAFPALYPGYRFDEYLDFRNHNFAALLRQNRKIQDQLLSHLDDASIMALGHTTRRLLCLSHTSPLVHLLTRYIPVQSAILACLNIKDIINLSNTTRRFRPFFDAHIRVQGNINTALETYFGSPAEFRNVQARTDTIIGGDFVFDFMARHLHAEDIPSLVGALRITRSSGVGADFLYPQGVLEKRGSERRGRRGPGRTTSEVNLY